MSRLVARTRLLAVTVALLSVSACASATQPALRIGETEYTRDELNEIVAEQLGRDLDPIELRQEFNAALGTALGEDINVALTDAVVAMFESREVVPGEADAASVRLQFGLPEDFDPDSLSPADRAGYDFQVQVFALQRVLAEEGSTLEDALDGVIELDPRYGDFSATRGFLAPAAPSGP